MAPTSFKNEMRVHHLMTFLLVFILGFSQVNSRKLLEDYPQYDDYSSSSNSPQSYDSPQPSDYPQSSDYPQPSNSPQPADHLHSSDYSQPFDSPQSYDSSQPAEYPQSSDYPQSPYSPEPADYPQSTDYSPPPQSPPSRSPPKSPPQSPPKSPSPSPPKSSSPKSPPTSPKSSSPPPPLKQSPKIPKPSPPPPNGRLDSNQNSTNSPATPSSGLRPYGSGDDWSGPIHATWYGSDSGKDTYGACYGTLSGTSDIIGVYTAAGSKVLLQEGAECGACYQIRCTEEKLCTTTEPVTVRLTNACPKSTGSGYPWCDYPRIHFDMSKPAFSQIADVGVGALQIDYRRVDCPVTLNIAFSIRKDGNPYWIMVAILNVGGPGSLSEAWVKGEKSIDWYKINRNWGSNWSISGLPGLVGQSLSFKLKGRGTEQYVIAENVVPSNWAFGETYSGGQWSTAN